MHPLPDSKQREVFAIACHIFTPNLMTTRHNSRTRCPSKTKPKPPLLQETATETPDLFEKTNRSAPQSSRFRQFHQQIHTKLNTYPSSDSWRGARLPAGAYKRAEFPAAFPEKKSSKKNPSAANGPRSPGSENEYSYVKTRGRGAGTSTAEQRGEPELVGSYRSAAGAGGGRVGEGGNAPLVLEGDEREALGLHLLLLATPGRRRRRD